MIKKLQNHRFISILLIIGVILCVAVIFIFIVLTSGKIKLNPANEDRKYQEISFQGKNYKYKENVINILCLGIDKDEELSERNDFDNSVGQADVILLASIDLENNNIRVIAIPRDTMVDLYMYNGNGEFNGTTEGQLTLQYAYADGMEKSAGLMVKQVSNLLGGIPINGYVALTYSCIPAINDAVGGVDVVMDASYGFYDTELPEGSTVHLTGEQAIWYLRFRDTSVAGSAMTRMDRHVEYLNSFVEQAKSKLKEDYTLPLTLLEELEKYMITDIEADEIMYLATNVIHCDFDANHIYTLPGETVRGEEYEEYYLDEMGVQELILELLYEPVEEE